MGKGGKKKSGKGAGGSGEENEEELLAAAIAENAVLKEKKEREEEERKIAEMEAALKKQQLRESGPGGIHPAAAAALQFGTPPQQLTETKLVQMLNEIPSFAIMNEKVVDGKSKKSFVPLRFADADGNSGQQTCTFFIDPNEAQMTLQQAQAAAKDLTLVIGVMPLGNALALALGWAEAQGACPFSIRGEPEMAKQVRPQLKSQLDAHGLASWWQLPVILCQELQSSTVLPVFFTREGLHLTWEACGREGPPPEQLQVIDMRMLVHKLLAPFAQTGFDANIVRFVGSESGWKVANIAAGRKQDQEQEDKRQQRLQKQQQLEQGRGDAAGSGDASAPAVAAPADPADEPPPLESSGSSAVEVR